MARLEAVCGGTAPRPTVVMDAGIATEENIVWLGEQGYDWIAVSRGARPALPEGGPEALLITSARHEVRAWRLASEDGEARLVDSLRMAGRPVEDLLGILTCRFADGREIALDEFPLARALSSAEAVRAEEIVLSTPDGRSVTTLINATPIHAEDGAVASVVVAMQDLAPLQELERMRAAFLGMVSHELRTPLAAIKGSTAARSRSRRSLRSWPRWSTGPAPPSSQAARATR